MAVIKVNFYSQSLMRAVDVNVILPIEQTVVEWSNVKSQDEIEQTQAKFKTLYLLHGIMGDHNDWLYYSDIVQLATANKLAVVMPNGGNEFYVNRSAHQQNYSDFIGLELPSMMERMFPLSNQRESRFIGGLSMGGYGALVNGLRFAGRFSYIFGLSSALFLDDMYRLVPPKFLPQSYAPSFLPQSKSQVQAYYASIFGDLDRLKDSEKDYYHLAEQVKTSHLKPIIMLACGQADIFSQANREFAEYLQNLGYAVDYLDTDGSHDWLYWSQMIKRVMDWLPSTINLAMSGEQS